MKLIKIINGTYGYRPEKSKCVEPKQAGDPPFEVSDEEARRLVALKVAAYVAEIEPEEEEVDTNEATPDGVATSQNDESGGEAGNDPPDGTDGAQEQEGGIPAYGPDMPFAELQEIMADCGLTFRVGMSKKDIIAALDEYFADADDGEAPPTLDPEALVI